MECLTSTEIINLLEQTTVMTLDNQLPLKFNNSLIGKILYYKELL